MKNQPHRTHKPLVKLLYRQFRAGMDMGAMYLKPILDAYVTCCHVDQNAGNEVGAKSA